MGIDIHPNGKIFFLPVIAGYVGADTVGVILATEMYKKEKVCLALDIGTTTIRMHWINLENGNESCTYSMVNPQIRYGNNVIDRINYANNEDQKYLEVTIRKAVNEMINHCHITSDHIYEMTVIGNSVMRDLFMGNPVESLGRSPFEPQNKHSVNVKAKDLKIKINPKSNIYALPLLSHFVGADTLAVILGTGIYKSSALSMAVDIGTNTEIVLGNKDKIIITSCASGPAFEGSGLNCGTGAVEGAIQKVEIDKDWNVTFETIGGAPPIGICGSGLIDALAEMLEQGILDWTGKFSDDRKDFVITDDEHHIYFDGEDIDTLKLAKAAIAIGIKMVMRRYGVTIEDIEKIYLAGAFGTYLDLENAIKIGLLPTVQIEKLDKVGNIALEGVRYVLVSIEKREEAEMIPKKIEWNNGSSNDLNLYIYTITYIR